MSYNHNYTKFLTELIEIAIEDADLKFITSEWCRSYARVAKLDYRFIVKRAFYKYCSKLGESNEIIR